MDKEDKIHFDDVFDNEEEEEDQEEEKTPENTEEIMEKNIEERDKSNIKDKEIINKFNEDNLSSTDKIENIIDQPDLVEQSLMENQNNKTIKEIEAEEKQKKEKEKEIDTVQKNGKNKIKQNLNKIRVTLPDEFKQNANPFDFIDFMERKYNKYILDKERDKYFYLEKHINQGKFPEIKCYNFIQKNTIMNHILKTESNYTRNKSTIKITSLVADKDSMYIGDSNGIIKIFSSNSELEIGPLNINSDDINIETNENISVTSMDILSQKNLLACGYYNGLVEIWDLKNRVCKKKLEKNLTEHKGQILAVKFLNGFGKTIDVISSDSFGLVNITTLTEKLFTFIRNAEFNAEVNPLIDYHQPIFAIEILKFTEEEKKMPFLKNNVEIAGFACYDYVLIYQISPTLLELYKFIRPPYFKDFHLANISFGLGYLPRKKDIIDINREQNQNLNEKASEYCLDSKNTNRLIAVSWDTFIVIYAIKYDREKGVENVAMVGYYIHSSQIKRMLFVSDSTLFIFDKKGKFKLFNTGLFTPGELIFNEKEEPLYIEDKEKRALIQEMKNVTEKVQKQNYIPQTNTNETKKVITMDSYYNSIYSNEYNIYILGQNDIQLGKIFTWEECVDKLKDDSEWMNDLIFGLKLFKGEKEFISFPEVPIDDKRRKEIISNKMCSIIEEYVKDRLKLVKGQINEAKYNKIVTETVLISMEFCFGIQSCNFLFKTLLPIFVKKNLKNFFYDNLEPYIINGNIGNQIFEEPILKELVVLYSDRKEYQRLGQIIKNLYLSVGNSEIVGNRVTKYDTIFTGLLTFCSSEKNEDYMLPAREIYSYFQKAKEIPDDLYLKEKLIDEKNNKKAFYFDYENIINNIDIDELILSYQYLGSMLLWYIRLCFEGYKFPSGTPISDKKYEELIQQLFLWLINDEVLTRLIDFDCFSVFNLFKKFFIRKLKILEKIEYSDLFKLIKIGDKELNEANVMKYFEIIYRKAFSVEKGKNIYVIDDLYDFICSTATIIQFNPNKKKEENKENEDNKENEENKENKEKQEKKEFFKNILLQALQYALNYEENIEKMEKFEQDLLKKKIENYKQNYDKKEKYDRYCLHLNKYKDKTYFLNLTNTIIAAIENNIEDFSSKDIEDLLRRSIKTGLTKVKIYLAKKLENFEKCLDIYLTEFKGEEQIILTFNFITDELNNYKQDAIQYQKVKEKILEKITEIAALSIYKLVELTDNYFNSNYPEILFKINNNSNKLKYLEEIIIKYKEDEMNPSEPVKIEYEKILKLHIDLLCSMKYFDQILPNLKKREFYPLVYCLEKCHEYKVYDACIYLERKSGNIAEAIRLVNVLTKENFDKYKIFYSENYEIIKSSNREINSSDDEDITELIDIEEENKNNQIKEQEILYEEKNLIHKLNKILRLGIDICEASSQKASKEESKKHWQSLISKYYELIKEIKIEISNKKITKEIGDNLIKELENKAGEITEKMNSYFDLNSVLLLMSQIQGESFGVKEYKSFLKRLLFSGESFNRILQAADSILKLNVIDVNKEYKKDLLVGKYFQFKRCDACNKIFKESDKDFMTFNCGHICHYDCCIIINKKISCKACFEYEKQYEETMFRGDIEIKEINIEEQIGGKDNNKNKNKNIKRKSKVISLEDKLKEDKLKMINKINDNYFEITKIFESSNH